MLRAVAVADRHPQHQRQLQHAGGHGLPLGHLIEDLVAGAADEVAVHQLHHHAPAAHGVADRAADDRRLRDGRVEQAVIGQQLGEAAVHRERPAPVPVLLTVGDQRGVDGKAVGQRLEQGVAQRHHPRPRQRLAVRAKGAARAPGNRRGARVVGQGAGQLRLPLGKRGARPVGEHHPGDQPRLAVRARRVVRRHRQPAYQFHTGGGARLLLLQLGRGGQAVPLQIAAVAGHAVRLLPARQLLAGPVGSGVGGRVPGQPVGDRVEQRRAAPRLQEFAFGGHRGGYRQRVVAVYPFGVQPLGVDPGADPRQHLEAHGLARGLAAHAVEVVEEVEQHRRGTAQLRIPQGPILLHGGEGDRFPGRPAAGRGVADIGDHDSGPAVAALEQRRAGGDGSRAADDGVVGHASERREEGVHGAAEPAVQAGGAREDFRQHAVEDEVARQFPHRIPLRRGFDDAQHSAFEIGFHDALQLRFRQRTDRARALGEDLAVAAVRPEDQILRRQRQTQAHHRRFLTD